MSRISHKYKFIFFAYPKTASTSIRNLLDPYCDIIAGTYKDRTEENPFYNHITAAETKKLFEDRGWDYSSYYKFVVIRNPWTRLVSLYNMSDCNITTFKDWVLKLKPKNSNSSIQKWKTNGAYSLLNFAGDGTNLLVDCVLKMEEIDTELPKVFQCIGICGNDTKPSIPKLNEGKYTVPKLGNNWRKYYNNDPEIKRRVKKLYSWELKQYNYCF